MKRKRAYLSAKNKTPVVKKTLQNTVALVAESHVMNNESEEPDDATPLCMVTVNPSTSTTIKRGRQADSEIGKSGYGEMLSHPNALSQIIAGVIKEITKDAGGLTNLSRSLVGNSISNGQTKQPHADMDHEENQSQHHQNPGYKQEELNAALKVIKRTMKLNAAEPFNKPVDPISLGIPDYFDIIKTPMDFGTICNNLENGVKYMNSGDVFKDVEYIWSNCVEYNKKGDVILELMKRVKTYFMKYWKAAKLQIEQTAPVVESWVLRHKKEEKDNPQTSVANNSAHLQQKEAGQTGQPQQSSNLPQSSSSTEQDEPNPDSVITPKKHRGPTRCLALFNTMERIKITTNELGQPVGPGAAQLTTFVGVIARDVNFAPLTYNWKKIPPENKENMWQKVLSKFDIDPSCRRWVLLSIRNKWRTFKSRLKANHYDVHETDEDRLADRDQRVPPDQWSALVSQWSSEKSQSISAKLKATCARIKFRHTAGPKSYARIREEERAKRPDGQEPSQAELFILTRTRKNGKPVNEATAAVISQLYEETSCNKDIGEDDAYNRVMKPYKNGGLSLYGLGGTPSSRSCTAGPTPTPTPTPTRGEALKLVEEKDAEIVDLKKRLSSVEQTCSQMAAQVAELVSMINHNNNRNHPPPREYVDGDSVPVDDDDDELPPHQLEPTHEVPKKQTRGRKKRSELNPQVPAKQSEPPTSTSNPQLPAKKTRGRPKKR
ncbi:bromodomain-containing factor 2 isoform X2 [Lactuca sativa]|uniref:Bromo domain-containing protein n=1 Tax=Lactuca sativa TaxID=4236 RepID=A0A9R1UED5_LACSA|nr:bromodomain-containing factor 2 isoform X2 [Lactuca sativa]KAJ0185528.1 hypothetical protein LSAT_V11C900504550 [Lactuca sativa]